MNFLSSIFLTCAMVVFAPLWGQKQIKHTVYFDVDKYSLTASEQTSFENFMRTEGRLDHISNIRVTGHTDADASSDYNLKLSQNRVKTVSALLKNYYPTAKIQEDWLGESEPLNSNSNPTEKQLNRRVEITLECWVPDLVEEKGSIKELYKLLEQEKQRFCIHPKGDTTIVLDQGTILYFPSEPFGSLNVPCVEIRAKEFYKISDMLMENLSTTADGRLLETAGMVYIEATVNGNSIELQNGKKVLVMMPAETLRNDMQGFNGERDPHSDIINWTRMDTAAEQIKLPAGANCERLNDRNRMSCERCTFFFCRIGRIGVGLKGIVNGGQRSANKSFRRCQRDLRKKRNALNTDLPMTESEMLNCLELDSLFKKYGVENRADLLNAMNKEQMDKYGVKSLDELRDTLNKIKIANVEQNLLSGNIDQQDLQYYMYNTTKLGWINTDAFLKLPGEKVVMNTDLKVDQFSDCKALFIGVKGILPSSNTTKEYQFQSVPKGNEAWLIGMRFKNGQAYLSLKKITTSENVELAPFQEVTTDELKEALKKLN